MLRHRVLPGRDVIERSSPHGVDETVRRLADAAVTAGTAVFATIDHAAGARSVGLDMPETKVLIVGNATASTPAVVAAPDLALVLLTRLLVRQAVPGASNSTIIFSDPTALARRYGLSSEQVTGLAGVASLVDQALGAASDA
jgi:uncharacterized protein (DUF302 family)